jgi:hypothetical protein
VMDFSEVDDCLVLAGTGSYCVPFPNFRSGISVPAFTNLPIGDSVAQLPYFPSGIWESVGSMEEV